MAKREQLRKRRLVVDDWTWNALNREVGGAIFLDGGIYSPELLHDQLLMKENH